MYRPNLFQRIFTVVTAIIVATAPLTATANTKYHVIVDPGHGGKDSGAIHGSIRESEIALKVGRELAQLINESEEFKATLTRKDDKFVTLDHRTKVANEQKADLFVSIHCNSSEAPQAKGVEFYFLNQLPPEEDVLFLASKENDSSDQPSVLPIRKKYTGNVGQILEDLVRNHNIMISGDLVKDLKKSWQAPNKGHLRLQQAPFRVLSNVEMPSTLVEIGFITNPQEGSWLADKVTHKQIARNIFEGIKSFKEKLDKTKQTQ